MTKDDILKKLGSGYEIVATGAEGAFEGYDYADKGLTFIFEDDGALSFISCGENFTIEGVKLGMNFTQIQDTLGKSIIEDTWFETPDNKAYKISYEYNGCIYEFMSFEKDGSDSMLTILRKRPQE
jgi:hypothetical protein